jgi:cell division protein FtsQ
MSARRTIRGVPRGTAPIRRASGSTRGGSGIRRASAGFNRTRSLALLVIILASLGLYGANASAAFDYRRLDLVGASLTSDSTVRDVLGIPTDANLFRLSTDGMAARLRALPAVADASVEVRLPDTLQVRLVERAAIVVWQTVDGRRFLVDADRVAFAEATDPTGLPVVDDRRVPAESGLGPDRVPVATPSTQPPRLEVGGTIDPVVFDAATRLGSLRPLDVGSGAAGLHVTIDDTHGFSLDDGPNGWTAFFGFYTPTIRKTDLIPGQVRLLRSLLGGREATIATVTLADDLQGTYTAKTAP